MKKIVLLALLLSMQSCTSELCEYEVTTKYPDGSWATDYFLEECS